MTNLVFKLIAIRHWSKKVPSVESEVSTNGKNHNQIPYNVPPPQRTQTFTKRLGLQNSWNTIMMNSFKPWLHNEKSLLIILYLTKMGTCQGWWFKLVFSVILIRKWWLNVFLLDVVSVKRRARSVVRQNVVSETSVHVRIDEKCVQPETNSIKLFWL